MGEWVEGGCKHMSSCHNLQLPTTIYYGVTVLQKYLCVQLLKLVVFCNHNTEWFYHIISAVSSISLTCNISTKFSWHHSQNKDSIMNELHGARLGLFLQIAPTTDRDWMVIGQKFANLIERELVSNSSAQILINRQSELSDGIPWRI